MWLGVRMAWFAPLYPRGCLCEITISIHRHLAAVTTSVCREWYHPKLPVFNPEFHEREMKKGWRKITVQQWNLIDEWIPQETAYWMRCGTALGGGVTTCDNLSRPDQKIKTSLRKGGERRFGDILRWIFYIQIRNLFFLSEDIRTTRNTKTTQLQNVDIIPTIHTLLGWPHRNHLKTLQSTLMKAQRRQTVLSLRAQIGGI